MDSPTWEDSEPVDPKWEDSQPAEPTLLGNVKNNIQKIGQVAGRTGQGIMDLPSDIYETGKNLSDGKPFMETPIGQDVNTVGSVALNSLPHIVSEKGDYKLEPGGMFRQYQALGAEPLKHIPGQVGEEFKKAYPGNPYYDNPIDSALALAPLAKGIEVPSGVSKFMKNTGQSIEANATAGALDLNTLGINKLAKRGQNPESVILDLNEKVQKLMPDLVNTLDTPSSKFQKLLDANERSSNAIGRVIDTTSKQFGSELPEADAAISELKAEAASPRFKNATSQRNIDSRAELLDAASHLEELKKNNALTFDNLYEVKKGIGEGYFNPNIDNPGLDKAYHIITKKIDDIVDRASIEEPSLASEFDHAKQVFKLTSKIIPVMKKGVSRDVAGAGGGMTNAGLGGMALLGHPGVAGAAYVGKTVAKTAFPDLARNVIYNTVNVAKNIPSAPDINQLVNSYLLSQFSRNKEK